MKQKLYKELTHDKLIVAILKTTKDKELFVAAMNRAYLIGFLDQPFDLETIEDGTQ